MIAMTRTHGLTIRLLLAVLVSLTLAACGTVPTNEAGAGTDLKNYERSHYERFGMGSQSLYDRLGGREVIAAFVDDGVDRVLDNPEIDFLFDGVDIEKLKFHLTEQICELAGGPCRYEGMDMESAHFGLMITSAQFNALVEDFQHAMRAQGVSYGNENRVLALLAPMKPAIVGH